MSSTNKDTWEWINPTTMIKEILGELISTKSTTGGHGSYIKNIYRLNGIEYVIEGYIGQGMDSTKGMATISKTS